jgi:hypothetical protein
MNIDLQLERNQKLEHKIDLFVCCAFILTLLIAIAWAMWDAYSSQAGLLAVLIRGALVLLMGLPVLHGAQWVLPRLTAHVAPRFIIDASDPNVVRLYGSLRGDGIDKAEEKLLAARHGLQLYRGNAYEDFGCTLAAIPASAVFLQARTKLQKVGVSIK